MTGPVKGASMGAQYTFIGFYDDDGKLVGGTRTAPANGLASGSPLDHVVGIKSATPTTPDSDTVQSTGDDDLIAEWALSSIATRRFNVDLAVYDLEQIAQIQNTNVVSVGDGKMGVEDILNLAEMDGVIILQGRTKKQDVGVMGKKAWSGVLLSSVTLENLGRQAYTERDAAVYRYGVTPQAASNLPWGFTIQDAFNAAGARKQPFSYDNPVHMQVYRGDGAETDFVTQHVPISVAKTYVVTRIPGGPPVAVTPSSVTPATRTVVISAPPAGAEIIIWYEFSSFRAL